MKRILTLVVAVLCSAVIFAQADYSQHLIKSDFTKEIPKAKIEKPNKTRDGIYWSCTFEESTPRYTTGQLVQSDGNWELQTKSESNGNLWYYPLNSTNPNHPYGVYSDTPEHWMMIEAGNEARQGFDFDSYILFTGLDFSETQYPLLGFYEFRQIFNITPEMEATIIEVSTNGGSTWTKHVVGCENMSESGFYYRRVPIYEAAGFEDVAIRFRAKRSESLIQSTFGVGYNRAQFIVHWQVDDVVIEEDEPFDFVITDVRMNKGECDIYSNPDYASDLGAGQPLYYQYSPMFGQVPVSEWTSPSMYASFNVAVENRGFEPVIPIVTVTVTNPNGEEIWTVDLEGEEVGAYEHDTIDIIERLDNNQFGKVFKFTDEQMRHIVTGRYVVTYTVSTEVGDDPTPANNTTSHPFYITEEAYSPATPNITRTCGPNSWPSFQDGHEILANFEYTVLPEGEIPVYVYISGDTDPGTAIAANIYEYNPDYYYFELTNTSGTYTIQESDLGEWIEIPLEVPLTLTEFDSNGRKEIQVGIVFYQNGVDNELSLGASNDMPNKGWICLYNTGSGARYTNVGSESVAPAICLGNPNPVTNYTITVNSANAAMGTATGGGVFANGRQIQISATPNNGYRFIRWNDGSTANPRNITVTGNAAYTAYFARGYTITVASADDAMGSATGGGIFNEGERIIISATANSGYRFTRWHDGSTANPRIITVTGNAAYIANFEALPQQYTISVVSANETMGTVTGGGVYDEGTILTITATPNQGYRFVSWNDGNTNSSRTITVTGNATYIANFEAIIQQYTITVLSANETMGTVTGGGVYDEGTILTITATPNQGYRFVRWNDGNTNSSRTITVTGNAAYIANFEALPQQYTITVLSANETMGTVTGGGVYDEGTILTITATPNQGYRFVRWNDGNTNSSRTLTVTGNATYIANFEVIPQQYTITVFSANETMGTVDGGGTFEEGTEIQISATAYDGYRFIRWNDGNTDNPRTITVTQNANYIASFEALPNQYTITVLSANETMGTVDGGGTFEEGTEIQISATAYDGYIFVTWSDGITDNPRTITVTGNAAYIANFEALPNQYTITVFSASEIMGSVTGGGVYYEGEQITISATANSGYRFSQWQDGSTANPRAITVTGNATYIASFEVNAYYSSFTAEACGSYIWNDQTYTESGAYQQTFTASNFADSIVTLMLTIHPLPLPEIIASGVLDGCNPSPITLSAGNYTAYNWSTGATTATISISEPGYYYVEVTDENGCIGISNQINVGISNAIPDAPQIAVVGLNNLNQNVVSWSAVENTSVSAYRIYRENNVANVYEPMATVVASAQTFWTDETADPSARAYRYKVTAVDECGGESPMSDYHKTMHLTINQGIGNTWNLIWSHYEGFNFGTYRIYRGTMPSNMTMIGEVPSNLNSYTDNTATANTGFYYQVEVVRNTRSRDVEISSRSNIVDNGIFPEYTITVMSANPNRGTVSGGGTYPEGTVVRIEATALEGFVFTSWNDENTENPRYITVNGNATFIASFDLATGIVETAVSEINLFPNPATDILNITSSETISEVEIVNVMGQVVKRIEVNSDNAVCDVEDLKAGVYMVRIHTEGTVVSQRKFVRE